MPLTSRPLLASLVLVVATAAQAEVLTMPQGAALTFQERSTGTYPVPIGPYGETGLPTLPAQGVVTRQSWRIGGSAQSSFQILDMLREQLQSAGYDLLFLCETEGCGGFDFRFSTEVIDEPDMHVDLGDFQFLSAHVPGNSGEFTSLLVSRSPGAAYVQVTLVVPLEAGVMPPSDAEADSAESAPAAADDLTRIFDTAGRVVLSDLVFESGSARLGAGDYPSLQRLAAYLAAHPASRIALVGHTDTSGSLEANQTISKRRAEAVRDRLVDELGVDPAQVEAEGVGYLSPLTANQTEDGRAANRRVEAVLVTFD